MANRRLRYGKGKGSIEITGTQKELLEQGIRDVAPLTLHIIESELDNRVEYAKKHWIVRGDRPVESPSGKRRVIKQKSKRSIDKFETGIRIISGGNQIEGFFSNVAPYAYKIRAASYSKREDGSDSTVPEGKLVAQRTMWFPAASSVDKLVSKLADAFIKEQKKVR
jgi:hypothetical protein